MCILPYIRLHGLQLLGSFSLILFFSGACFFFANVERLNLLPVFLIDMISSLCWENWQNLAWILSARILISVIRLSVSVSISRVWPFLHVTCILQYL